MFSLFRAFNSQRQQHFLFITFIAFALLLSACSGKPLPYKNITNAELEAKLQQGIPIIDIRRLDEWHQTGIIQGSHRVTFFNERGEPVSNFMPRFSRIIKDKNQEFILICRTGNRTQAVSEYLSTQLGYTQVVNVTDGITRWISEGYPVKAR